MAVAALLPANAAFGLIPIDIELIKRGDANSDDSVDLTDPTYINNWLFLGGPPPPCLNQADANNDGSVTLTDSVYLNNWLFLGGPPPPAPGPNNSTCKADDKPYPGCDTSPCD